jgi:hypothetical protein
MKLAEAILDRSEVTKRITELQGLISQNAVVQEGTDHEDVEGYYRELIQCYDSQRLLNEKINRANNTTPYDGDKTIFICDALSRKENIDKQILSLTSLANSFRSNFNRHSLSEIRSVPTMDPKIIRKHISILQQQRKDLDRCIQKQNWSVDIV